jgi:hypothetical protein
LFNGAFHQNKLKALDQGRDLQAAGWPPTHDRLFFSVTDHLGPECAAIDAG